MSTPTFCSNEAADNGSRKRPLRHFHQGPDNVDEEAAFRPPPVVRLYTHALESIFGFLTLTELAAILAVSRSWAAAVGSMRRIDADVESSRYHSHSMIETMCRSRLARHIGSLGSEDQPVVLNSIAMHLVDVFLTGLRILYLKPTSSNFGHQRRFPPSLTYLTIDPSDACALEVNSLIDVASRLPGLTFLQVYYTQFNLQLDFAPLRCANLLCTLSLDLTETMSPTQANALRAIPHLTNLDVDLKLDDLRLLLRAPHRLELEFLSVWGTPNTEATLLLTSLDSLTALYVSHMVDLVFLNSLPNLRALELDGFVPEYRLPSPAQLTAELGQCSQLTALTIIDHQLTTAHVVALLSHMPVVCYLKLSALAQLDSLAFLSTEPLHGTLVSFWLESCRHAHLMVRELVHVFSLPHLTSLELCDSFSERLDSMTLYELTPPSQRLPKLVKSVVYCDLPTATP